VLSIVAVGGGKIGPELNCNQLRWRGQKIGRERSEIHMPRYRVTIVGRDYDAMADLVRKDKIDVLQHTVRHLDEGGYSVDAIVDDAQMRSLESRAVETESGEAREYTIERHEDVDEAGKARQEEVGKGDDYEEEQLGLD
jgi:hypothetical protein